MLTSSCRGEGRQWEIATQFGKHFGLNRRNFQCVLLSEVHGICSGTPCLRVGTALGFALRGCDSPGASCRTQEMITERELSLRGLHLTSVHFGQGLLEMYLPE